MFQPVNTKHRKVHRPTLGEKKVTSRGIEMSFGVYGLKAVEGGLISSNEIGAGRMAIKRGLKKLGNTWIRVFPDMPVTAKKGGVRMGKGKGNVVGWQCAVSKGQILFELSGIPKKLAFQVLRVVGSKMSVKTKFVVLKG